MKAYLPPIIPVEADDLCMETLLIAQIAKFPDERDETREEDSRLCLIENIMYSIARLKHDLLQYPELMLPSQFRDKVITHCHNEVGHQSLLKTIA